LSSKIRRSRPQQKVFLSAPFTQKMDLRRGVLRPKYKLFLYTIKVGLERLGYSTYLAHEREKWGRARCHPAEFVREDFRALRSSSLIIAYLEKRLSTGVLVELGWASALRKPVILFAHDRSVVPLIIQGLNHTLCSLRIVQASSAGEIVAYVEQATRRS